MLNFNNLFKNLKGELLVITIIITVDLYQIPKLLEHRKNFGLLEFWNLFGFVQVIVFALCLSILSRYDFRLFSSDFYKRVEQMQRLNDQTLKKLQQLEEKKQSKEEKLI